MTRSDMIHIWYGINSLESYQTLVILLYLLLGLLMLVMLSSPRLVETRSSYPKCRHLKLAGKFA